MGSIRKERHGAGPDFNHSYYLNYFLYLIVNLAIQILYKFDSDFLLLKIIEKTLRRTFLHDHPLYMIRRPKNTFLEGKNIHISLKNI